MFDFMFLMVAGHTQWRDPPKKKCGGKTLDLKREGKRNCGEDGLKKGLRGVHVVWKLQED